MAKHCAAQICTAGSRTLKQWSLLQNHLRPSVMESRKMMKNVQSNENKQQSTSKFWHSIPSFFLTVTSTIAFKKSSKTSMSARTHITQMWLYSFSIKIAIAFWLPIPNSVGDLPFSWVVSRTGHRNFCWHGLAHLKVQLGHQTLSTAAWLDGHRGRHGTHWELEDWLMFIAFVEGASQLANHTTWIKQLQLKPMMNWWIWRFHHCFFPKDCHTARCAEVNLYRFYQHRVPLFPEMVQYGAVRLDTPS